MNKFKLGTVWNKIRANLFASASNPSSSADWTPVNDNRSDKVGGSFSKVTARIDQLIDDFPYVNNIQSVITSYVVGDGIRFSSRVVDDNGEVTATQKRQRRQIEDAIKWANDEIDIAWQPGISSGAKQGWEMERLSCDRRTATGESCFIIHHDDTPGRYIPFALQPVSTLNLTEWNAVPEGSNKVYRGIEYDPKTAKIKAYHFDESAFDTTNQSASVFSTVRVPAEYVIYDNLSKHPGQFRGISPLAASVLIAHDFEDVFNSEIDAAKMTAKMIGTVKTPDAKEWIKKNAIALNSGGSKYQQEVQNSLMQFIGTNESIDYHTQTRPSGILLPFTQLILRMMAANANFPFEVIAADFTGMNYTVTRSSRAHHQKMIRPKTKHQITHVNQPINRGIIQSAVLSGRLHLPGYWSNPRHYERCIYQLPGLEPVDPFRQAKADAENLSNLIESPQEICARRGVDFEDVMEQYKAAVGIIEDNGFDSELFVNMIADKSSTSTQSNGNASSRSKVDELNEEIDGVLDYE